MKDVLNRAEIRACLKAYLTAKSQHAAILKDNEVQHWFEVGNDTEALRMIAERYPYGRQEQVNEYGKALVRAMYRKVPAGLRVDPELMYCSHPDIFQEMLALAKQV